MTNLSQLYSAMVPSSCCCCSWAGLKVTVLWAGAPGKPQGEARPGEDTLAAGQGADLGINLGLSDGISQRLGNRTFGQLAVLHGKTVAARN